jgi:hypothetical protein
MPALQLTTSALAPYRAKCLGRNRIAMTGVERVTAAIELAS